jgi:2-methylisocitrate lyase-like PEP mutase family enzyme
LGSHAARKGEHVTAIDQRRKADAFRAFHVPGRPFVLFNVWDAGSAGTVVQAGAKAIGTSSWAVAASHGLPDGEQVPVGLVIENLKRIVAATPDHPVTVDLERGYGDAPTEIERTVARAIAAGAVGMNIEDGTPPTGRLRETAQQCERIRAARRASQGVDVHAFLNARTDVFLQRPAAQQMVDEALERARAYADAGADGLFVPGLSDLSMIGRLVAGSPLPVNVMVDDATPSLSLLAEQGVARVSHGPRPYAAAMKALEDAARIACS